MSNSVPSQLLPLATGLILALGATGLWITEQATGNLLFELAALPLLWAIVLLPAWSFRAISQCADGNARGAVIFVLAGVGMTILAAALYLPFRANFATVFDSNIAKFYYPSMFRPALGDDEFQQWLRDWQALRPHLVEFCILAGHYCGLVAMLCIKRIGWLSSVIIAVASHLYLIVAPLLVGHLIIDYDFFFRGVIFDSISYGLSWELPVAGDHSIFLYVYTGIFYAAALFGFSGASKRRDA